MKRLLLLSFLMLIMSSVFAADYYWVGGSGNWSQVNLHWSSTSGGAPDRSVVPTSLDDVYFDANSGLDASSVIILPTTVNAACRNMSWVGVTTAATFRANASNTALELQIYGNLELSATVKYGMVNVRFMGNSNATYKNNGAQRITTNWYNQLLVTKTGGSLKLLDGIPENLGIGAITFESGTLDLSGNTHEINRFIGNSATGARTLNLTNATLKAATDFYLNATNTALSAIGSSIITAAFTSNGLTFSKVEVTGTSGTPTIANTTLDELLFSNPNAITGSVRLTAGNTVGRLEFKGGGRIEAGGNIINKLILAPSKGYIFRESITVNELFQFNTPDCEALGQLTGGPAISLNIGAAAVADIQNVLLTNMVITGNVTPVTVQGADGGGNTGFNIQPRATGTTLYWVGGAGDWGDKSHWATTSGGTGGACVPFTGDNVIFDANSGFTAGSKTVTVSGASWCHHMTWTNVANAPIFNTGTNILEVYGNIELDPTLNISGILLSKGSEESTFTTKGSNLGTLSLRIEKTANVGGLTLTDDINFPNLSITYSRGKLVMANRNINMFSFVSASGTARTLDISNSTITVSDNWNLGSSGVTWVNNAAGSFITSNRAFTSNGLIYPKVYLSTSQNSVNIVGTTITELVFTNTSPTSTLFALNGAGNNTIGTLDVRAGGVTFMGNNTINNLLLAPSKTYYFRNTQTITGLMRLNSPGCEGLGELRGFLGTNPTLNFGPAATKDIANVYVQNMTATGSGVPISVAGADAGGNTGFNITASAGGARYWIGGSGDWNDSAHWSITSGGAGGACIPTAANDVFFDANSFTAGSSAVTVLQGNAYCRNMDWTGANNAPTFTKPATLDLEIWGNMVMNANVKIDAAITFTGPSNTTLMSNGGGTGGLQMIFAKPVGNKVTLLDNFSNALAYFFPRSGGLDLSNRTISMNGFDNTGTTAATDINITNANITGAWRYQGTAKTLQAANSIIKARRFLVDGGDTYNVVDATGGAAADAYLLNTTVSDLLFSNPSAASAVSINANNAIGRLEFKGRGNINGTGNTIETLIFAPGRIYTFLSGSTTTITKDWFGSGTPCNLTEINSSAAGAFTVNKTTGGVEMDYVRLRNITASGSAPFKALEHSEDLGGNTNWSIEPYNNTTPILGLGADKTLCADAFPYTIKTDGFFASPMATFAWGDGSTGNTLVVAGPGTYTVTVSYPDGCSRTDNIVLTRSDVVIAPITGTANACVGATTNLATTTAGGVWSSSNTAVATVSTTGVVTGVAAGTADIIYTVTNGNGCVGTVQQTVTINAMPTVATTAGPNSVFAGNNITVTNATAGGVWSSSNTAVATVDAAGLVTGVAAGTTNIIYTVTGTGGCEVTSTHALTVDAFDPSKRVISITKTADAAEPATHGAFAISLPTGINAVENITVNYTVTGTATAGTDYTALTGTATILAGQNSVAVAVEVINDTQIENIETVIASLNTATSTNYTYTINGTANNATVQIADDDDVPANRLLSVTSQLNVNEPANTGSFTIALPTGVLAPENITVTYTMSGTATNGDDYETLSGTATILAGQNNVVVDVKAIDDQIVEQTETIILTLTGGTSTTAGSFGVHATNGVATLLQADNDYTAATRMLAVTSNGNAAEPGTHSSFTISLPTGYVSSLPITVTYALSGTATYGSDYNSNSATTVTLPAGQNSVNVPINVINDSVIEQTETVVLTITNGVATQGATTVFSFTPNPSAPNASMNIADDDNAIGNKQLSVTAQNGAEPATNGRFTISLPAGITSSENITLSYNITGNATSAVDYKAITGPIVIPAGQSSVEVPLIIIDDKIIEGTENVTFNLTGASSTNFNFGASPASATAQIADDDAAANTTVVLLTKVSDAVEGGTNGQYRISLPPGVTSAENITISFNTTGTATRPADYNLSGAIVGADIVIPAGSNEVFVNVNALTDAVVEGPETVILNLVSANAGSTPYTIDPTGNGAVVTIVDANASFATNLQVTAAVNGAEPATSGSFTIGLIGGATSAYPITVGYSLSGTAIAGLDYQNFGTITLPANQNSITIPVQILDDQIIEDTETMVFTILSGNAMNAGVSYSFPPSAGLNTVTVNIADNDATVANRVLAVVKTADAAEPDQAGSFTISLPTGYTASSNIPINYVMSGTATQNSDYTINTITLPANTNSVTVPVLVIDDQIIENTEAAALTLVASTAANGFVYSASSAAASATVNIADDDNTIANRTLSASATGNATEGGAAGGFSIKLPGSMVASAPITVNYTVGGTATSVADYAALTGTATIATGQNSVVVALTAVDDNVIEPTETVTLTITGGTSTLGAYTAATGNETATVDIIDNDANVDAKRTLSIVRTAHAAEPATHGGFRIQLPTNMSSAEDITVNYTVTGTATRDVDYTALSGTIVIPAGQNNVALPVQVIDDFYMESTETVIVALNNGTSASFAFPITAVAAQNTAGLNIVDEDNIPANRLLTLTKTADAAEPGTNGNFRVSLPTNILCPVNINVNYFTNGSTATSGVDFQPLGAIVIPAGQNYVDIPVRVIDDQIIEPTEIVRLALNGTSTAGFGFTISVNTTPVNLNIADDDDIPANRVVNASVFRDGEEGGNSVRFNFSLPTGIIPSENITVNYTVTGTAQKDVDYTPLSPTHFSGIATISAGSTGGTAIVANIVDDQIIEGTENITITITGVTSANFTYTFGGPVTANIIDNDNVPANLVLAVAKTADAVEGGANGEFTISLPGTTTTATEAITVNYTLAGTASNGTDYTGLSGSVVIPAGDHEVKIPVNALVDQIIEGTETVILTIIGGNSTSFAFTPSTTNASATVDITDATNTPANRTLSIAKLNDAAEPSTSGRVSIALPTGVTATENISVSYTVGGTATPGTDYASLSGTATILAGQNNVIVPISVIDDQLIEQTETVNLTLTAGNSTNFAFTAAGNVTVNIADDDNIPANLVLNVTKTADAAEPTAHGNFNIALPTGITVPTNITVNYTVTGTATAGKDYATLSGTATILAGQNSVDIPLTVIDDQEVEGAETVTLAVTSGTATGLVFTGGSNATIDLADDDNIPANLVLTIAKAGDATEPSTDGSFSISLPTGITVAEDITVNYTVAGTATAGTDYTALTGSVTIPAGQNSVNVPVLVIDDQIIEGTETVIATLTGATSASFTLSAVGSATVNIIDDENTVANRTLTIAKTADAAEPASHGNFSISLPTGITATQNITVNYTVAGTATAGTDYAALTGTATILAGQNAVNIPVLVNDDKVIEGAETVIATLTSASAASFSFIATGSATLNIADDDNTAANRVLAIVKTADAAEPATNGNFNISLPTGVTAKENIIVSYTVGGTATAGTDYTPLTGTATILAGQNSVNVPLLVADDNVYEPIETVVLSLTGGTSTSFSFTASTTSGSATANITDNDKMDQVITFTALPTKILGDPSFTLNATGGASGNPVTFVSSNPAVATISGNVVTIVGVGTVTITASQAGNAIYHAAADVSQVLTVIPPLNTAPTLAVIANQQICLTNAPQSVALSGISAGTETAQTTTLSVSSSNPALFSALSVTQLTSGNGVLNYTLRGAVGTATVTVTVKDNGGTANGGVDVFTRTFTITASALPQVQLVAKPGTSVSKGQTIEITATGATSYTWATATGTIPGQTSATLSVRPAQTTTYTVTGTNASGCTSTASITITVIEDYNVEGNNVLTPNGDGKNDFFVIKNIDMYPNNEVRIFDRAGRAVYTKKGYNNEWDGTVNGKPLEENTYYYIIDLGKGVKPVRGYITIVRKY